MRSERRRSTPRRPLYPLASSPSPAYVLSADNRSLRAPRSTWHRHFAVIRDWIMTPRPRLTFITIIATLAYLGLAILGWGGFAAFFSHPALIALSILLFAFPGSR